MKVRKKTRLLAALPKVNLKSFDLVPMGEGYNACVSVDNSIALKGYTYYPPVHTFMAKVAVNGGEARTYTFGNTSDSDGFSTAIDGVGSGDTVRVVIEIDPSKVGEFKAGTMERTATAV